MFPHERRKQFYQASNNKKNDKDNILMTFDVLILTLKIIALGLFILSMISSTK